MAAYNTGQVHNGYEVWVDPATGQAIYRNPNATGDPMREWRRGSQTGSSVLSVAAPGVGMSPAAAAQGGAQAQPVPQGAAQPAGGTAQVPTQGGKSNNAPDGSPSGAYIFDKNQKGDFLGGLSKADTDRLSGLASWDQLAETLIAQAEQNRGGRFNEPLRNILGSKADDMRGLLALEAVGGQDSPPGESLGSYYNARLGNDRGSAYDVGHGRSDGRQMGKELLEAAMGRMNGATPDSRAQAFGKDQGLQFQAVRAALTNDVNPILRRGLSSRLSEMEGRFSAGNTSDPRFTNSKSYLDYARNMGLY